MWFSKTAASLGGAAVILTAVLVVAQTPKKSDVPTSNNPVKGPSQMDQKFMQQAAIGDAAEIQLGQMAQEKASNPKVKQFGERMVNDHSKADDQLKGIAQSQHVGLPTELDAQHQAMKSELSKKTGAQFDKAYMLMMVQEHTKTINKFKQEAQTTHDPTLKQFAQSTLPILESHLSEAKQVSGEVNRPGGH